MSATRYEEVSKGKHQVFTLTRNVGYKDWFIRRLFYRPVERVSVPAGQVSVRPVNKWWR